ncbi:MAG: VOC family protein [Kiloniellaceae bacterium]
MASNVDEGAPAQAALGSDTGALPAKLGSMNHLRLTVSDIPRAEKFYAPIAEFMGYRLVEKSENRLAWAAMTRSGNLQWLIMSAADPDSPNRVHDRYAPGLHHFAWNAETREQVDMLHELLLEHGVKVLDPPAEYDYEPGYYAVFFADPDGLKLELVHVPASGSQEYWATARGT